MTHPGGRPRTISLSPEEMTALGVEMVNWVKKNDPIHLSKWWKCEKHFTNKEWDAIQQNQEFFPYYEEALLLVGYKYVLKNSPIEPSLKQRWLRVYFKDLKREEDETAQANAERSKAIERSKQTTYNIMVPHGLAIGSNVPAAPLPTEPNQSPE